MRLEFPKEPVFWNNYVEKLLKDLRIDYDRLWQFLPQIPDPEAGIPYTGPLVPTPFCWPFQDCAIGSVNTGGTIPSGGTPVIYSGGGAPGGSGTGGCGECTDNSPYTLTHPAWVCPARSIDVPAQDIILTLSPSICRASGTGSGGIGTVNYFPNTGRISVAYAADTGYNVVYCGSPGCIGGTFTPTCPDFTYNQCASYITIEIVPS